MIDSTHDGPPAAEQSPYLDEVDPAAVGELPPDGPDLAATDVEVVDHEEHVGDPLPDDPASDE